MRILRLVLPAVLALLFLQVGCSTADDDKDVNFTGVWSFIFDGGYSDTPARMEIVQEGTTITITYVGTSMIFHGICDPGEGTFSASFPVSSTETHTLAGHEAGEDVIIGTWRVDDAGDTQTGPLSATRVTF